MAALGLDVHPGYPPRMIGTLLAIAVVVALVALACWAGRGSDNGSTRAYDRRDWFSEGGQ